MCLDDHASGIPAAERALVGLCHDLNDQLAAVSAYAYLLNRRGMLGDLGAPLHEHLDRLAHSIRMVRSLCRNTNPEVGPVALGVLAEAATELMRHHPDGPVRFCLPETYGNGGSVVQGDWSRSLRALLHAAAWARRGIDPDETVEVLIQAGPRPHSLDVRVEGTYPEALETRPAKIDDEACIALEPTGDRSAVLYFLSEARTS